MASETLNIALSSPPDRDELVAEIFVSSQQLAEINTQFGYFCVEIYPRQDGQPWVLDYRQFLQSLTEAKARLIERIGDLPADEA